MLQDYYRHLMENNDDVIEHYRTEKIDLSIKQKMKNKILIERIKKATFMAAYGEQARALILVSNAKQEEISSE